MSQQDEAPVSRAEFEALVERVEELEAMLDEGGQSAETDTPPGIDHRDQAVLDYLDVGGRYSRRAIVTCYRRVTDITNENTARNRAKQLVRRGEFFRDDGSQLVFQGVGDGE